MTYSASSTITNSKPLTVMVAAVLISIVFSALIIFSNHELNDDAFSYLRAAELFNESGLYTVLNQYGWYTYSILIALADHLLPGDLLNSAQILNTLFYAQLVWVFIACCRHIYNSDAICLFAAVVILGFPQLNELRHFIIRDVAFWAFSLTAMLNFLRYSQQGKTSQAVGWVCCTLIAVLFRLEALLPFVIAPFSLLLLSRHQQPPFKRLARLAGIIAIALIVLLLISMVLSINLLELAQYAYRYYLPRIYDLSGTLSESALAMNAALFTADNFPAINNIAHALPLLLFAYAYTVIANAVITLSIPLSLLLLFGVWKRKLQLPSASSPILLSYLGCTLLALYVFQLIMHFQTQRYATLLCLILLIPLSRLLERLWLEAIQSGYTKKMQLIFLCAFIYFYADSLVSFGHSKQYVEDASTWLQEKLPEMPADATLTTNVPTMAFISGRINRYDQIVQQPAAVMTQNNTAKYLIIELTYDDLVSREHLENPRYTLLKSFNNSRGDEIRIYRQNQTGN